MSLIGLAFAVAGIVLAFRRDFKEAAGVFAVGIVAVLLATPAGINLLGAEIHALNLSGSHTGRITGDGLKVEAGVFLRGGFRSAGRVRLI